MVKEDVVMEDIKTRAKEMDIDEKLEEGNDTRKRIAEMTGQKHVVLQTREGLGNDVPEETTAKAREQNEEVTRQHQARRKKKNTEMEDFFKDVENIEGDKIERTVHKKLVDQEEVERELKKEYKYTMKDKDFVADMHKTDAAILKRQQDTRRKEEEEKRRKIQELEETKREIERQLKEEEQKAIDDQKEKEKEEKQIFPKEIEEIEKWTKLKAKEIIFNSEKDNWEKGNPIFKSIVRDKEQLVFFVETTEGIVLGGVFMNKITSIGTTLADDRCFLFSNQSGEMIQFPIDPMKSSNALKILFTFGYDLFIFGNDLVVKKEDAKYESYVNEKDPVFMYPAKNSLLGREGTFDIKKILVIQLE